MQTSFQFPVHFRGFGRPFLLLEQGMHKPSSSECLAPFYQDHTQRIAALSMTHPSDNLFFRVEALLKLAEGREGCEIGWDEWKMHVVIPSLPDPDLVRAWVSGCRLFYINLAATGKAAVEVYDFSMRGRAKYLREQANANLGGVRYLVSTGTNARLPWETYKVFDMRGGHDSVVFSRVRILLFSCTMGLSDVAQMIDGPIGEDTLHIWSF